MFVAFFHHGLVKDLLLQVAAGQLGGYRRALGLDGDHADLGHARIHLRLFAAPSQYQCEEPTGKSQAELIRQWADSRKVVSKSDATAVAELRRQGGLIKTVLVELRSSECLTDHLHGQLEDTLGSLGLAAEQIIRGGEHDFTPDQEK